MKRQISILLDLLIVLALSACGITKPSPSPTPTPTPMPSGKVDVGGHELYYQCSGQGSPTVILESGGDVDSSYWAAVFNSIKRLTRVCMYDRANLGRSDKVPGTRTFYDMTRDLQVLLENAHIGGPYILVGWSMGGFLVRIFAGQHPTEVVGIVLVDSAHPDMGDRLTACLPPESANEPENIQFVRMAVTGCRTQVGHLSCVEGVDVRTSDQQARDVESLGDLPLVVISQAPNISGLGFSLGPLPVEVDACLQQTWQAMQNELAELSSHTTWLTARGGHMIPLEQPALIAQAVIDLVEQSR